MTARVIAARAIAGLLLGSVVVACLVLAVRQAGPRTTPGTDAAGDRAPGERAGGPVATSGPGGQAPGAATATTSAPGPVQGTPAQADADPCRLVTRAEVAAVLGQAVVRVQPLQGFLVRSCVFSGAGSGRQVIVQVNYGPAASQEQFRMARTPGGQAVGGVGDEARFTPDTGLLDVRKGPARFQVGLLGTAGRSESSHVPSSLLALARKVTGRI